MNELVKGIVRVISNIDIREIVTGLDIECEDTKNQLYSQVNYEVKTRLGHEYLPRYVYEFLTDYVVEVAHFTPDNYEQLGQWYLKYLCIYEQLKQELTNLPINEYRELKKQYDVREKPSRLLVACDILHKFFLNFSFNLRMQNQNLAPFTLKEIRSSLFSFNFSEYRSTLEQSYEPKEKKRHIEPQDHNCDNGSSTDPRFFKSNSPTLELTSIESIDNLDFSSNGPPL